MALLSRTTRPKMVKCTPHLFIFRQMSVSPWMTLMTVFIVQFSILRSSRSLTSVYLDGDNWLIIWWSESGIKVWGGGGGTAHTVRGRGPSIITDQVWGCSHAGLQQLIVLRNTELWPLWQGMHLGDCLVLELRFTARHSPANIIRLWHDPLYKPFVINEFYIRKLLSRGGAR